MTNGLDQDLPKEEPQKMLGHLDKTNTDGSRQRRLDFRPGQKHKQARAARRQARGDRQQKKAKPKTAALAIAYASLQQPTSVSSSMHQPVPICLIV